MGQPGACAGDPAVGGGCPVMAAAEEELEHTGPWRAQRPVWSLECAREASGAE